MLIIFFFGPDVMIAKAVETSHAFGQIPYIGFEHATMVPMCRKLIDVTLLTAVEKAWLNSYHSEVLNHLKPFFERDSLSMKWLERETMPL